MNDLVALMCMMGFLLLAFFAFAAMSGLFNRGRGMVSPYATMGNEYPRYDDPHISSGGSFGSSAPSSGVFMPRSGGEQPRFHDPHVRSGGSFG